MRQNTTDALNRWSARSASTRSATGGSVWTDGEHIYSYGTTLVTRLGERMALLNLSRYSTTTSGQQNALAIGLVREGFHVLQVDGVPRGYAGSLDAYVRGQVAA